MKFDRAHLTESFLSEYIHGDRFVELADWAFNNDASVRSPRFGGRDGVVFCCTHYVEQIFEVIRSQPHRFILITHNSDWNVTRELYAKKPPNVVHWFAQNVLVDEPDLTPIPIGLERQGIVADRDIAGTMNEQILAGRPERQKWCYLNISPGTNSAERRHVLRSLRWKFHFVTTRTKRIRYPQYLAELAFHRFVISPPGNGVDCHRTWESLYLGSIPIVKDSVCMRSFASAGLMIVPDVSAISKSDFRQFLGRAPGPGDQRLLYFSHWRELISTTVMKTLSRRPPSPTISLDATSRQQ